MQTMLHKLLDAVDDHWHQIADHLADLDAITSGPEKDDAELAGAVASRVLFHLGDLETSLTYALNVPRRFNPTDGSEYSTTLVNHAINKYIPESTTAIVNTPKLELTPLIDKRLHELIQRVIENHISSGAFQLALKMSIECHRPHLILKCMRAVHHFINSPESKGLEPEDADFPTMDDFFNYTFLLLQIEETPYTYKQLVLHLILDAWKNLETPNWITFADCLTYLGDNQKLASLIDNLALYDTCTPPSIASAYQICFNLVETTPTHFRTLVASNLHASLSRLAPLSEEPLEQLEQPTTEPETEPETEPQVAPVTEPEEGVVIDDTTETEETEADKTTENETQITKVETPIVPKREKTELELRLLRLEAVLSGEYSSKLNLKYLFGKNATDDELLLFLKNKINTRDLIGHSASLVTHGYFQCGTTCDDFLKNHKKRLKRTILWAKMSVIASIGVIHKNHLDEALGILKHYLDPAQESTQNPYEIAGGLYGYGLVHSRFSPAHATEFVSNALRNSISSIASTNAEPSEESVFKEAVIQHGACLGLGICSLGANNSSVFTLLNSVLGFDNPTSGEAAALGIGLNSIGIGDIQLLQDLVGVCRETKHDRVKRGVALAIGLISYGKQHDILEFASELLNDQDDHFLRLAGVYSMGLGFCGTQSITACSQVMHRAVSDLNADVRRKAATMMAFIMFRDLDKVLILGELLCESYHPHVRYGGAMALGFAAVATGNEKALALIEPLFDDTEDYVRQAALISTALILLQQKPSKIQAFHERLIKLISGKHTHRLTKLGAIYALGILYAGGQHVTISLLASNGLVNLNSVVGLFIFNHFWEWHPLSHFLSLAFQPSSGIFLNHDLRIPKLTIRSNAPKSEFSITEKIKKSIETSKPKSTALKAELSTTKKIRAIREAKKLQKQGGKILEEEEEEDTVAASSDLKTTTGGKTDTAADEQAGEAEEEEEEPFQILSNTCRITNQQWGTISIEDDTWTPLVHKNSFSFNNRNPPISLGYYTTAEVSDEAFIEFRKPFVPSSDDPYSMEPLPPKPFTLS